MKKLFVVALLIMGMTSFAQEKPLKSDRAEMEKLTPEQRNQLHLKELTLKLDLTASQQKEMAKIIADSDAKREASIAEVKKQREKGIRPTAAQRFEMKNKRLDEQIAIKERAKKFLSPEQMEKWEKIRDEKKDDVKRMMKNKENKTGNTLQK